MRPLLAPTAAAAAPAATITLTIILTLLALGCGKVSVATESNTTPATVADAGTLHESSSALGKDHSEVADAKETRVRLERTVCYGLCPVYSVEIHGDGVVDYEGKMFVGKKGKRTATIDPQALRALVARFDKAGFFRLDWADPCAAVRADKPGATLTFTTGLRTRTIIHDHGNTCMPEVLRELEDEVDRVAGTAVWVACNADGSPEPGGCPR